MRLHELAEATGSTTASLKYYQREGLLPPGETVHATLAEYGEGHVQRVRMIKALRSVAGLGIGSIRGVVERIEEGDALRLMEYVQAVVLGLDPSGREESGSGADGASHSGLGDELARRRGWTETGAAAREALDSHLELMRELGFAPTIERLETYAAAVELIAAQDVEASLRGAADGGLDQLAIVVATGIHLQNQLLLRMLAVAQGSRAVARMRDG